jgi:hypothetical protein
VTNAYGVYVENIAGAGNNYAIYTNAGPIRFGGNVGFAGNLTAEGTGTQGIGTSGNRFGAIYGASLDLTAGINVFYSDTSLASSVFGVSTNLTYSPASGSGTSRGGGGFGVTFSPSAPASADFVWGVTGSVTALANSTVSSAIGHQSSVYAQSGGAITTAYLFYGAIGTYSGGTIGTAYGLYLGDVNNATTNYAIYTGAGTVQFGDEVVCGKGVQLGSTTKTVAGTLRYNGGHFQGYNGSTWVQLD